MNIECYDNGGRTIDRYTVIYLDFPTNGDCFEALGMSYNPTHPQGFCQFSDALPGSHLGKKIDFDQLPDGCQEVVQRRMQTQFITAEEAENMGRLAHKSGVARRPINDVVFTSVVRGKDSQRIARLMRAWLRGWDKQNLA